MKLPSRAHRPHASAVSAIQLRPLVGRGKRQAGDEERGRREREEVDAQQHLAAIGLQDGEEEGRQPDGDQREIASAGAQVADEAEEAERPDAGAREEAGVHDEHVLVAAPQPSRHGLVEVATDRSHGSGEAVDVARQVGGRDVGEPCPRDEDHDDGEGPSSRAARAARARSRQGDRERRELVARDDRDEDADGQEEQTDARTRTRRSAGALARTVDGVRADDAAQEPCEPAARRRRGRGWCEEPQEDHQDREPEREAGGLR